MANLKLLDKKRGFLGKGGFGRVKVARVFDENFKPKEDRYYAVKVMVHKNDEYGNPIKITDNNEIRVILNSTKIRNEAIVSCN